MCAVPFWQWWSSWMAYDPLVRWWGGWRVGGKRYILRMDQHDNCTGVQERMQNIWDLKHLKESVKLIITNFSGAGLMTDDWFHSSPIYSNSIPRSCARVGPLLFAKKIKIAHFYLGKSSFPTIEKFNLCLPLNSFFRTAVSSSLTHSSIRFIPNLN